MAKSKNLFTAADFTKDGGKKKSTIWIVIAAIVVIAVVAVIILAKKDKVAGPVISEPAQEVVTTPAESAQPAEEMAATPAEEAPAAQEAAPKAEEVKAQPAPAQPAIVKPVQPATPVQYTGDASILNGKTLNEKANIVIRGTFGNNPDRKRALGDAYQEIQDRVNEMYRNGEVR